MTFLNRRMLGMALTIFVLDRLSKYAVVEAMELKTIGRIDIWEPYLTFRMAWNQGVNFGMFNLGDDGWWILIVIAAVIVGLGLYWARHATGWMIPLATGALADLSGSLAFSLVLPAACYAVIALFGLYARRPATA